MLPLLRCSLVFSLCVLPVAAYAQGGGRERPRPVLQALDLDHDGTLSAAEIAAAPTSLRALDRNGDGMLTPDELEPPRPDSVAISDDMVKQLMSFDHAGKGFLVPGDLPERMRAMFTRADSNHDGKLTPGEIRQSASHAGAPSGRVAAAGSASGNMRLDPLLNALDADHDGTISAAEMAAAAASLRTLDKNGDGQLTPDEMRVRQQTPAERAGHVLEENDTDGDGKLSRAEAPEFLAERFADADTNHDGFLDLHELTEMMATMPAGRPGGGGAGQNGPRPNTGQPGGDTQPKGEHQ